MPAPDPATTVAGVIAASFDSLAQWLRTPAATVDLLRRLGWEATAVPPAITELRNTADELVDITQSGIASLDPPVLIQKVVTAAARIDALRNLDPAAIPVAGAAELVVELPGQLVRHLLGEHLLRTRPRLAAVLRTIGVLVVEDVDEAPPRPAYVRVELVPDRLVAFLTNPLEALTSTLGWGLDPLDAELLFDVAGELLAPLSVEVTSGSVADGVVDHLSGGAAEVDDIYRSQVVGFLLDETDLAGVSSQIAIGVAPVPPDGALLPGLAVLPFANAAFGTIVPLSERSSLTLAAEAELGAGLALVLRPGQPPQMLAGVGQTGAPALTGELAVGIEHRRSGGEPILLVGTPGASRIEFRSLRVAGGGRGGTGSGASAFIAVALDGAALVVQPGADADALLARLLPGDGFRLEFDLEIDLDSRAGLTFAGSGGLEVRYPTHVTLGPVELDGVRLAVRPSGAAVDVEAGADVRGTLGPLVVALEDVGLSVRFDMGAPAKNLGFVDLRAQFKPPTGAGVAIDATVVSGGGYLSFDPARGEYSGVIELELAGFVSVAAVGLVTTRQPDGGAGFSMLVAMSAQFTPGIQLGLGFTLVGVGGLVGLNRGVRLDALAEGIRTGAAETVLFPTDVVANAPRILSDLRTIFPQQQGTFLVGPMLKVGWGTPTLVSLSLGLVIEIPGNVALLGVLKVALPSESVPLVQLKVSFVGAAELDKRRAWFFASLFDSRVLVYPVQGEMGVLVSYGSEPSFVLSVGGFHPSFDPPPLPFPVPQRIGVSILNEPGARIMTTSYFAVTSNTAQFGARAELVLGFDSFGVEGVIGYDALFRFSPFSFLAEASANLSLQAFGVGVFSVHLDATLEGPAPWHVLGRGSVSLLFFDISADFELTWGETAGTLAPPLAVLDLVRAELEKAESWTTELPAGRRALVTLRPASGGADVVLHPAGALRVSQRAVPLGIPLDKVGAQRAADVTRVSITAVTGGLSRRADATEQFALAQFQDMSDADKLSLRPYEPHPGGVVIGGSADVGCTSAAQRVVRYEEIVVDTFHRRFVRPRRVVHPGLFDVFVRGSAVATSAISDASVRERVPFADTVAVAAGEFVVASTVDNRAADTTAHFSTEAEARDALAARLRDHPELAGELHVIPAFEEVMG